MSVRNSKYLLLTMWYLLLANTTFAYTHADTLRGSNGRGRDWWDVKDYVLSVDIDNANKKISGYTKIKFTIVKPPSDTMQIDLQDQMILEKAWLTESDSIYDGIRNVKNIIFQKEGNVYWLVFPFNKYNVGESHEICLEFSGKPRIARNPPWDGGFIWGKDSTGNPWISVACQGLGASAWWPCKDAQWDEPDSGITISFQSADTTNSIISNGKGGKNGMSAHFDPFHKTIVGQEEQVWRWKVKNPINLYDVTFYMGDYVHWSDTMMGEKGILNLDFYALRYNEAKARAQFKIVKPMLHCFEYWMGPYPFYEDGYKLVEAPHLGMEHQSAVAYGNNYKMGYRGMDRSGTGVGLLFDFIIVHESGHEWFGNNVTAYDIADNWIHEGITTYTEAMFAECQFGKEKAFEYLIGQRRNIRNSSPVIGNYGVNSEGASDMYDKGATVMHMIRIMMHDDDKFRSMLRTISEKWYHGMVTSKELEQYMSDYTGLDLKVFFDQYLRSTKIPELEYYIKKDKLHYRFNNILDGFTLPVEATNGEKTIIIQPTASWQSTRWKGGYNISFSKDLYIKVKS